MKNKKTRRKFSSEKKKNIVEKFIDQKSSSKKLNAKEFSEKEKLTVGTLSRWKKEFMNNNDEEKISTKSDSDEMKLKIVKVEELTVEELKKIVADLYIENIKLKLSLNK